MAHLEETELQQINEKRLVYALPTMRKARVQKNLCYKTVEDIDLLLDIYTPPDHQTTTPLPAVIFLHGDGPDDYLKTIKDSGQFVSWGQLITTLGFIAVTAHHRGTAGLHNIAGVANDIDDLITYVREHSRATGIDADNLCLWTFSAGAPFGFRAALHETPPFIRSLISYYGLTELAPYYHGIYDAQANNDDTLSPPPYLTESELAEFSAIELLQRSMGNIPPLFIARAGLDNARLNQSLDRFVAAALAENAPVTIMNHPDGQHGFDILDNNARSIEIIRATLEFLQEHLVQ
jgi:acetyl esterase/lipase